MNDECELILDQMGQFQIWYFSFIIGFLLKNALYSRFVSKENLFIYIITEFPVFDIKDKKCSIWEDFLREGNQ